MAICTVCLNELAGRDSQHSCTNGHTFHQTCLEEWMHTSQTCPVCRVAITDITDVIVIGRANFNTFKRVTVALLNAVQAAEHPEARAMIATVVFRYVEANFEHVCDHPTFRKTVAEKINTFSNKSGIRGSHYSNGIARRFSWMGDIKSSRPDLLRNSTDRELRGIPRVHYYE